MAEVTAGNVPLGLRGEFKLSCEDSQGHDAGGLAAYEP